MEATLGSIIASLATLTAMEIVLGIDNIVFISILCARLPLAQQEKARKIGLGLALGMRLLLLMALSWVMELVDPLFTLMGHVFSGRDLILLGGGTFLVYKATHEIYEKLEGEEHAQNGGGAKATFGSVLVQIALLDIIFSLDSVITAVGMAQQLWVMVTAMVLSVGVMLVFAGKVSAVIERHPSLKVLALSFLMMIGVMLAIEGMGQHVSKGYIYTAMTFSLMVEFFNMRLRIKSKPEPVKLHGGAKKPEAGLKAKKKR